MTDDKTYFADFMKVYETLEFWAPSSEADTKKAFFLLPQSPTKILEIGCGKGLATKILAENSGAHITALDNEESALERLRERFQNLGLSDRLTTINANMSDLPSGDDSFDLIWSEGSAYIIGVEKALKEWMPLLRDNGFLVISDLVWHINDKSADATHFWQQEYPDMQNVETRIKQISKAGYSIIDHFPLSNAAWHSYYDPLRERVLALEPEMPNSKAIKDIKREVEISTRYTHEFGYHFFIMKKE